MVTWYLAIDASSLASAGDAVSIPPSPRKVGEVPAPAGAAGVVGVAGG